MCVINQADLESVLILEKRESIIERLGRFMKNHEYISRVDLLTYGKYNQNIHHRPQKYIWPYGQMESTLLIFTIIYYQPHQKRYRLYHIIYRLYDMDYFMWPILYTLIWILTKGFFGSGMSLSDSQSTKVPYFISICRMFSLVASQQVRGKIPSDHPLK